MAKVSLRIYNREIEGMIDQGRTDESIAHCHHILKTFPKHLETYRLLGKSYLESKRYSDAVDIFGRVLMSVPDDFVAHVGMSIIRDEENKLDDSIWHMERAFEAKSANAAIQGELQRLYGRRDGMEPPKIRMTRGALAHMYVQGELYPQAIAEIRAVLAQDPQRGDMQVLLALSYFKGGQKADASDMCTQLLKRYPFSFDANRIMVELLPATAGAAESTQVYRMRIGELDPYATFAKGSVFDSNEVADAAINLERLEYTGNEVPMGQEWGSSLGIGLGSSAAAAFSSSSDAQQPDWLKSGGFSDNTPQTPLEPASASQANDGIPDFLRAAGWGESNSPEQPTSIFDAEPNAGDLVPAEMPDWLKGQMPSVSSQPVQTPPAPAQSIETPDWLTGLSDTSSVDSLDSFQTDSAKSSDTPDWLSGLGNSQASEPAQSNNVPDWLSGLGDNAQVSKPESTESPDWLSGLGDSSQTTNESAQPGTVPDWLSGLDEPKPSEASAAVNVPDWLSGLDDNKKEAEPAQSSNVPDWLSGLDNKDQTPGSAASSIQDLGSTAQEQDDAVAWLESLAAKHGAKPEELVTDPNKRSETPPDWVSQAQNINQQEPVSQVSAPSVESLGSTAQEQDDAVAWLESLAAKHGAKPEELVTDPSKRFETPPEWVSQAQNLNQQGPVVQSPLPTVESLGSTAQEQDDAVAWLESLAAKHGAKPEELVTDPSKRFETPPEWVSQAQNLNQQEPVAQTSAASVESLGSTAQEQDDAVAWLESLAAKHGAKPEELVTDPSKRFETPPEWVSQAQIIGEAQAISNSLEAEKQKSEAVENALNIGEQFFAEFENASTAEPLSSAANETDIWLRDLEKQEKEEEINPTKSSDLPDWLSGVETEQVENQNIQHDDRPAWLSDDQVPATMSGQQPAAQSSDLPNWLSGIEEESVAQNSFSDQSGLANNDLSNWLSGLDDEPGLPFDALPTPDSILAAKTVKEIESNKSLKSNDTGLPDWLSDVDVKNGDLEEEAWKKAIEPESAPSTTMRTEELALVNQIADDLPNWLQGVDEKADVTEEIASGDDTPPWLHREKWEAEGVQQPKPTSPSDWHPITAEAAQKQPVAAQLPVQRPVGVDKIVPEMPIPVSQPAASSKKKPSLPAKPRQAEAQSGTTVLTQAKGELDRGDIPAALDHYGKLIKKGKHLEETIRDLTESLYRYPVEVGIWQTLGDAYMRANRLKEALESYNKAEELIR